MFAEELEFDVEPDSVPGVGIWIGSPKLTPLSSEPSLLRIGVAAPTVRPPFGLNIALFAAVHLAAARVAGATLKRSPICTVALLSELLLRPWRLANKGAGLDRNVRPSLMLSRALEEAEPAFWRRSARRERRDSGGM